MLRYAVEHQVEAIMIAGDLFDTKNVSAAARNVVKNGILDHSDIPFFYLRGNHDADSFLSSLEEMPDNLKMFGESWISYELDQDRITVTGVELTREDEILDRIYDFKT